MIYFVTEIQFICKDGIFLATTLPWDMNHAGHGIISNKKVVILKNCLTKLGIIPTGKVVLTWENVEYQFFSIFIFLCNTQILSQKAEINSNLLSQNLVILCCRQEGGSGMRELPFRWNKWKAVGTILSSNQLFIRRAFF